MKQSDLVYALADRTAGVTKSQAEAMLKALGDIVTHELALGGDVTLPGVGRLFVRLQAARTGRNPTNGEPLDIPAKTVAKFKPAKALAEAVA